MTQEESDKNEMINEKIRLCKHNPINTGGKITCTICGCVFAVMLLPVNGKIIPIVDEEYD